MEPRHVVLFNGALEADSPDHISSSQRDMWDDCRLRAVLASWVRLRPIGPAAGDKGRNVGILVHDVLASWYEDSVRSSERLTSLATSLVQMGRYTPDVGDSAIKILMKFWAKHGTDDLEVVGTEVPINIMLPSGIAYTGSMDFVYRMGGKLVVEDWKTSLSAIEPSQYSFLDPKGNDYLWALKQMYPKEDCVLGYLGITPTWCKRWQVPRHDISYVGRELEDTVLEQHTLPVRWHRSKKCLWCQFWPICASHLTGADVRSIIQTDYIRGSQEVAEPVEEETT